MLFVSCRLFPPGQHALRLHPWLRGSSSRPVVAGEPPLLRELLLPAAGLQESGQRSDSVHLRRARRGGGEGLEPVLQLQVGVDAGGDHLHEADAHQGSTMHAREPDGRGTDTALLFQLVFASICRNFWECGLVAIDDITVRLGDCRITAGKPGSLIASSGDMRYCRER